jgi:hypothetical protein
VPGKSSKLAQANEGAGSTGAQEGVTLLPLSQNSPSLTGSGAWPILQVLSGHHGPIASVVSLWARYKFASEMWLEMMPEEYSTQFLSPS